jgi:hypothetical protein
MRTTRPYITAEPNSAEEVDRILDEWRTHRVATARALRERISFLEAKETDKTFGRLQYESVTALQRRLKELEARQ